MKMYSTVDHITHAHIKSGLVKANILVIKSRVKGKQKLNLGTNTNSKVH